MNSTATPLKNNSDAARHVGLSESNLNKMRLTGGGPTFLKLGRRVLYKIEDLDDWLNRRRRTSTSDQGFAPQ
jgi:hypothetical protein